MQVQRLQCSHLQFAQSQLRVQTAYHSECIRLWKYSAALIDSGSSDSFISQTVAEQLNLNIHPSKQDISKAL